MAAAIAERNLHFTYMLLFIDICYLSLSPIGRSVFSAIYVHMWWNSILGIPQFKHAIDIIIVIILNISELHAYEQI